MSKRNKNGAKSVNVDTENSTPEIHMVEASVGIESPKTECVLESGIPIPPPQRSIHKFPFNTMEQGQSFVMGKKTSAASVTIAYWKKKLPGRDFTVRALQSPEITDLKAKGVLGQEVLNACRIWRRDSVVNTEA